MFLSCILATSLALTPAGSRPLSLHQDANDPTNSSTQAPSSVPVAKTQTPAGDRPVVAPEVSPKVPQTKKAGLPPKRRARKAGAPPPMPGEPRKIVVREGGTAEPSAQLIPGISLEEASAQRENAEHLLLSTEDNLRQLVGRALNPNQEETVGQIHNYMDKARAALKDGDTQRAHTLALKAQWLSDDLLHR